MGINLHSGDSFWVAKGGTANIYYYYQKQGEKAVEPSIIAGPSGEQERLWFRDTVEREYNDDEMGELRKRLRLAAAPKEPVFAILPVKSQTEEFGEVLDNLLLDRMVGVRGVTVLDRQALNAVVHDLNISGAGEIDRENMARLKGVAGLKYVVVCIAEPESARPTLGIEHKYTVKVRTQLRILEVKDGLVVNQKSVNSDAAGYNPKDALDNASKRTAGVIADLIRRLDRPMKAVLGIDRDELSIWIASGAGYDQVGELFEVGYEDAHQGEEPSFVVVCLAKSVSISGTQALCRIGALKDGKFHEEDTDLISKLLETQKDHDLLARPTR